MCELIQQINQYPDTIINQSLQGIVRIHNGLILSEECKVILRKDFVNMAGKVKLVSGGKIEDTLIYAGFIGPGMLTAAIFGSTCFAPSVDKILRVIEKIGYDQSSGIIFIIQNDGEYMVNFTLAKLHAEEKGYIIKIIAVNSNLTLDKSDNSIEVHNNISILFMYKLAGALSEEGRSIDEICLLCNSVAKHGRTILLKTDFCANRRVLQSLINTLNIIPSNQNQGSIYKAQTFCPGHEIAIIICNFGCNQVHANMFLLGLLDKLEACGLSVKRTYVKEFNTSVDRGFHICLLNLSYSSKLIKYLDYPTFAFSWPRMTTSSIIGFKGDHESKLVTIKIHSKDSCNESLQGLAKNYQTNQAFLIILSVACEAVIACTRQLNKMDEEFGDGNYGTNLASGAKAIQNAIQQNKILGTSMYETFMQISTIIQETVHGLQGGLYSLFFYYIAKAFLKHQSGSKVTVDMWLCVLSAANKAVEQFKIINTEEQKLLTSLATVQKELEDALNRNMDDIDAFAVSVKAAENFTTNILYNQSKHGPKYPDPQAHAVGIWLRAAYEGTKVHIINRKAKK